MTVGDLHGYYYVSSSLPIFLEATAAISRCAKAAAAAVGTQCLHIVGVGLISSKFYFSRCDNVIIKTRRPHKFDKSSPFCFDIGKF